MVPRFELLAIGTLIATGASAAPPPTLPTAKAYVDNIYRAVTTDGAHDPGSPLHPYTTPRYAPALQALIDQDRAGGEIGFIGANPLCDCQDHSSDAAFSSTVAATGPGKAVATIKLRNFGKSQTFRLDLAAMKGVWMITDVHGDYIPSLLGFLRKNLPQSGATGR